MSKSRKSKTPELPISTLENGKFQIREHTFWYFSRGQNFPPPTVQEIEEYDGSDRLSIACTQTRLKPAEQKKLVQRWCEYLPTLKNLKYLWFVSRVTQQMFDAATQLPSLEGLYVKWGGVTDFSSISRMKKLRALHMAGCPSLVHLEALASLKKLEWLDLCNIRAASDLSFVKRLPQLLGLEIAGDTNSLKYLKVDSLKPLEALKKLQWLNLDYVKAPDKDLVCLGKLRKLKYLHLCNVFSMEAVAALAGQIPDVHCDMLRPIFFDVNWTECKKCGEKSLVMLTGKGIPMSCRDCDAERIRKHVEKFEELVAAAKK